MSRPVTHSNGGTGVTRSPTCRRLIAKGSWRSRISSALLSPHTWLDATTSAKAPGWAPTRSGCAAAKGSAPHDVRSGRRSGCSSGAIWRRPWAGSPVGAGLGGRPQGLCRVAWLQMLTALPVLFEGDAEAVLSELPRGGGDGGALRRRRRCDVRAAGPGICADPAGTHRGRHGAAGRGHGCGHRRTRCRRYSRGSPTAR